MKNRNDASYFDNVLISHRNGWRNTLHGTKNGCTVVVGLKDGSLYAGVSVCSKKDSFNRKLGRAIASGRAVKLAKSMAPIRAFNDTVPTWINFNFVAMKAVDEIINSLPFKRDDDDKGARIMHIGVTITPEDADFDDGFEPNEVTLTVPVWTNV